MGLLARIRRTDVAGSDLATPGEMPVVVPVQPNVPPMMMRAPYDPAGAGSRHGRTSGGSIARQAGTSIATPPEYVTRRYDPAPPPIRDAGPLDNARADRQRTPTHRGASAWTSYHVDARRSWGIQPFFNGHHGRYRRAGWGMQLGTPSGGITGGSGANPVVARMKPLPWDTGAVRGTP